MHACCRAIGLKFAKPLRKFSTNITNTDNIPSRAFLYVPASDTRKLAKAYDLKVDCLVLNCEDGVALNQKDVARKNVLDILNNDQRAKFAADIVSVRVNDLATPFFEDDFKSILTANQKPEMIIIPKVNDPAEMSKIAGIFHKYKSNHIPDIIICIESAKAVMLLQEICAEAFKQADRCNFAPVGLLFGGDDYLASIGATKTSDHMEIIYARQKLVNVAKAFGLQAIDIVHINYKDLNALEEQCKQGMRMGYTGKQVIHPMQVETVHKCFSPNSEQIEWATALISEFTAHEAKGAGAFTFRGNMIDAPLMKQARNIIKLANK
ncbi:citramalyl-CoA lyase, mitochondrial-like [Atheta coriaria]|uniref:citramalyl-CoA lyase, mitochondrial-like n=1 Tax=Dalotia coriaria TaxID=877792 RepID=UPI0031F40B53